MLRKTLLWIGWVSILCWTIIVVIGLQLMSNKVLLIKFKNIGQQIIKTGKDIKHILAEISDALSFDKAVNISNDPIICVLSLACNRVTVNISLDQLLKYRPNSKNFPIVVSQDCDHEPTRKVIQSYGNQITFIRQPDQSEIHVIETHKHLLGYYKIARHYGWVLNQAFYILNYDTVIIVEDDIDIAPDFYEYFRALYPILKTDPTIYCISAYNDNGKEWLVSNETDLLYRSDFFPGYGWMLTKDLWIELQTKWPKGFWDDWLREPEQRKGRACIRPEISRARLNPSHEKGVSGGQFYEQNIKPIKLNEEFVPFKQMNLTYLFKDNYDVDFVEKVYGSSNVTLQQLQRSDIPNEGSIRLTYSTKYGFIETAKAIGLMDDEKAGVPRTAYRGVVTFWFKGRRVYLAPPPSWTEYDKSWGKGD